MISIDLMENWTPWFQTKTNTVQWWIQDFPWGGGGGRAPVRGGVDLRRGCFSVKMYAKTKELGPMGGGRDRVESGEKFCRNTLYLKDLLNIRLIHVLLLFSKTTMST